MKKVFHNFFYQALFQLSKLLIPLITVPIAAHVLGPNGVGLYNYTNSIVSYFVLFAGLGVTLYGNREIAIVKSSNSEKLSETFWEIVFFKGICSVLCILFYIVLIIFSSYRELYLIQLFTILAVFFDISWFFMGIEDFKKISISNIFGQFILLSGIIIFVNDSTDLYLYTLFQALALFLPSILSWLFVIPYIELYVPSINGIFRHFKSSIKYFIPQISITFYTTINKSLLGWFVGNDDVAFYTNALVLNNVFVTILTTVDVVLLPKMSSLFSKNRIADMKKVLFYSIDTQLFFSISLMFGMLVVYDKLVPWFFGTEFIFINNLIPYFSILIVIIPLGMSISRQFLLPMGNTKDYNYSILFGAILNILINLLFIRQGGIYTVMISNIIAELVVMLIRLYSILSNKYLRINFKSISIYIISGAVMCIFTRTLTRDLPSSLSTNLIQVLVGGVIYFGMTMAFNNNAFFRLFKLRKILNNPK